MALCHSFNLLIAFYIYFYMRYPGSLLIFFIAGRSVGGLHWGAEPRHELGTALQLPGELAAELRHTLIELRRTHARGHVIRFDSTSPPPSPVRKNSPNQASTCYSERRKTKGEVRYVDILVVLADVAGRGGDGSDCEEGTRSLISVLFSPPFTMYLCIENLCFTKIITTQRRNGCEIQLRLQGTFLIFERILLVYSRHLYTAYTLIAAQSYV
jgi:hypothetical protein